MIQRRRRYTLSKSRKQHKILALYFNVNLEAWKTPHNWTRKLTTLNSVFKDVINAISPYTESYHCENFHLIKKSFFFFCVPMILASCQIWSPVALINSTVCVRLYSVPFSLSSRVEGFGQVCRLSSA